MLHAAANTKKETKLWSGPRLAALGCVTMWESLWIIRDLYCIKMDAVLYTIIKCRARVEAREGTLMRKDKRMVTTIVGKDKLLKLTNTVASSLFLLFSPTANWTLSENYFQWRVEDEQHSRSSQQHFLFWEESEDVSLNFVRINNILRYSLYTEACARMPMWACAAAVEIGLDDRG